MNAHDQQEFIELARSIGLVIETLQVDNKIHRCSVEGKAPTSKDGAYQVDDYGGWVQNHTTDAKESWRSSSPKATNARPTSAPPTTAPAPTTTPNKSSAATFASRWNEASKDAKQLARHPYVIAKGIEPLAARLEGNQLLLPLHNAYGDWAGLQTIAPDGKKQFADGSKTSGARMVLPTPNALGAAKRILVCEGWATGATIHEATGDAVVVAAFSASNLAAVATSLRDKMPEIDLVVCGDDDHTKTTNIGLQKAEEAAKAAKARWTYPRFSVARQVKDTDFNDLHRLEGLPAVRASLEPAAAPKEARAPAPIEFVCAAEIETIPVEWLWRDWLVAGEFQILSARPGVGKSTIAASFAAIVSSGGTWPDGSRFERKGHVLLWNNEDDLGRTLVPRLEACGADRKYVHFPQRRESPNSFHPARHFDELLASLRDLPRLDLIVIDPLHEMVAGNMSQQNEVAEALEPLVRLAKTTGAAVLGVSHNRKGGSGSRGEENVLGSTGFVSKARMVLQLARLPGTAQMLMRRSKSNYSTRENGWRYRMEKVDFITQDGRDSTTTRIVWDGLLEGSEDELERMLARDTSEPSGPREEAARFAREQIASGVTNKAELYRRAAAAGHNKRTMQRAIGEMPDVTSPTPHTLALRKPDEG